MLKRDDALSDLKRLVEATPLHAHDDLVDEALRLGVQLRPLAICLRMLPISDHRIIEVFTHVQIDCKFVKLSLQGD